LDVLINKEHEDNRRCILAKDRHLKSLKLYLGLDKIEKEKPKKKIIWKSTYYNFDDNIKVSSFIETDKMFGEYKKCYMKYIEATSEKEKLAEEYNKKYEEFKKFEKEMLEKIFG
jgi:hypothetical protein